MASDPAVATLVDLEQLASWLATATGLGAGPLEDTSLLTGGTQNILVRFRYGDRELVLRRPPLHKRPNSDATMRREALVLAALRDTPVPHPTLVAACSDESVLGAAFYVTDLVDGFCPRDGLPPAYVSDKGLQHAMGLAVVEALAALGEVDHVAVGLADLGRADTWLERQVERWRSQLRTYAEGEGYVSTLPAIDDVADWLDLERPAEWQAGLIHGDYHLGNVLVAHGEPQVAAIVDWELTTVGDPLLDLGHLLSTWPRPGGDPRQVVLELPGLPSRPEVVDAYAAHSRRDLTHLRWYEVLARYRFGIILEGTYARALSGKAPMATGERLHDKAVALLLEAGRLIDEG